MDEPDKISEQQEIIPTSVASQPSTRKAQFIIRMVIVGGVILAMMLIYTRTDDVKKTSPVPTRTLVSPTDSLVSPTGVQIAIPTSSIVQCETGADCIGMSYCTDSDPPKCHTFICLRGYCREAIDEVDQEDIIRPMPSVEN